MKRIDQPLSIFLIGTTGDLAKKKILKAIYRLFADDLLPETFYLVGNARTKMDHDTYRTYVSNIVRPESQRIWRQFEQHLFYVSGDVNDKSTFDEFNHLDQNVLSCGNRLWYVSTLPRLYTDVIKNIKATGLNSSDCGWTKILLEKPFGTDLPSSKKLNSQILDVFSEDQIYRIDHFLAKETVQNLLVFRFANGIFEHLWNKEYIDHIQISATETLGIEGREAFYDSTGTVRDVVQNHVLQMLAVVMMEEPKSLHANDIRDARQKALSQLEPFTKKNIASRALFGQYIAGKKNHLSYTENPNIPDDSRTETAVALKCFVNNERWKGMPIYIRAGKQLKESVTQITIHFKEPQNQMFCDANCKEHANELTFQIQPNEGVKISFQAKKPGLQLELEEVPMKFSYQNEFQMDLVEAYVKLIHDAVAGDSTLFPRADGIDSSWKFVQPLLDHMNSPSFKPEPYPAGSWGPESFEKLLTEDNRVWIQPTV